MSATMARQGGRVQLELSDMLLALNMAKMAKGGFSRAAMKYTQQIIKKPGAKVGEEKKQGVEFPGQMKVKASMERHPAMVYKDHTASCLPCRNDPAKNPQTRWRRKEMGAPSTESAAPLPGRPPLPGTPPVPPGDSDGNESYEIEGMPSKCVYVHSPLPNTQCVNHNANAKDSTRDKDCVRDLVSILSAAWKYR